MIVAKISLSLIEKMLILQRRCMVYTKHRRKKCPRVCFLQHNVGLWFEAYHTNFFLKLTKIL